MIKIKSKYILAVEGKDEYNFFEALLKHQKIDRGIQILDIGGKEKFKNELPLLVNSEGFSDVKALGFVRDAEEKAADSAFMSICGILKKYELPYPETMNSIVDNTIKVGVFIMPNNIDSGMLEDLCIESIKDRPIYPCLQEYLECCRKNLSEEELLKFNLSKAQVLTFLASMVPIVNSLGLGARKNYWDFNHSCFSEIKFFIKSLYC